MASCCGEKRTPFFILKSVYIYICINIHIIYTHFQKLSIFFKSAISFFEFNRELFFHNQLRVPLDR